MGGTGGWIAVMQVLIDKRRLSHCKSYKVTCKYSMHTSFATSATDVVRKMKEGLPTRLKSRHALSSVPR